MLLIFLYKAIKCLLELYQAKASNQANYSFIYNKLTIENQLIKLLYFFVIRFSSTRLGSS